MRMVDARMFGGQGGVGALTCLEQPAEPHGGVWGGMRGVGETEGWTRSVGALHARWAGDRRWLKRGRVAVVEGRSLQGREGGVKQRNDTEVDDRI